MVVMIYIGLLGERELPIRSGACSLMAPSYALHIVSRKADDGVEVPL
jgi:hypothetical protein